MTHYDLTANFNINDYENWSPSHSYCNTSKSAISYSGLGIIKRMLDECQKRKSEAQRIELMMNKEIKKAKLLINVLNAFDNGQLTIQEVQDFVLKTNIAEVNTSELDKIRQNIEGKIEYQSKKMKKALIDLLTQKTREVLSDIVKKLGNDWRVSTPRVVIIQKGDNADGIRLYLQNNVDCKCLKYVDLQKGQICQKQM
ncbi:MAG: hypothetical protein WKG06_40430 [Segetibacter sp.]